MQTKVKGIDITHSVYEDPEVVEGYIQVNANNPEFNKFLKHFISYFRKGSKVIDIGCGPGHDSYTFATFGHKVVGIDYSLEMIQRAKTLKEVSKKPEFLQLDMRDILTKFGENKFDAAWISASLIHIPESEVRSFLLDLKKVLKINAFIYIGIKGGEQGEVLVVDNKYGKETQRIFYFWDKDNFSKLLEKSGFQILELENVQTGMTGGKPTSWLNYILKNNK